MTKGVDVGFSAIGTVANAPSCFIEKNSCDRNLSSRSHALSPFEQSLHPRFQRLVCQLNRVRPHGRSSLLSIQCATTGDNGF
ncbi:hypothetical protein WH7805_02287 [Synechococcus sp. WH 7805]|nr:hypothetical protein WH7805_02287 [Synechococcus sp. WH 7805]